MESMGKKPRRRRSFTPEFKAEIVELCQRGDRSVGQVAKDFDLTETAVREWVRQAERDAGTRQDGGLASSERRELAGAETGEPEAPRGRGHPEAGDGFLREGDPVSVYPFIEAEKAQQAQRQTGVRAAGGLPWPPFCQHQPRSEWKITPGAGSRAAMALPSASETRLVRR